MLDPKSLVGNDYSEFSAEDPYNHNYVEGYISRHSSDLYGALMIAKVNGEKCPQLIYCTPKLSYPFDRQGKWHFPKAKRIERYEKLDGTNIFAYRYKDAKGSEYVSFKTRLLPFVGNSKFGPFRDMLDSIIRDNARIKRLPLLAGCNISFELWGARNPNLVRYEQPLALSYLFARKGQEIVPPSCQNLGSPLDVADFKGLVTRDYVASYQEAQQAMEAQLKPSEDGYIGQEGEVWYLLDETGAWTLLKCKCPTIEAIHFSAGGIGRETIRATCRNAFENWGNPTVDQVAELLREEFDAFEVEKAYFSIRKHLNEAFEVKRFRVEVMAQYNELGISILSDKATVMRALSSKFARQDMKKVFSTIMAEVSQ